MIFILTVTKTSLQNPFIHILIALDVSLLPGGMMHLTFDELLKVGHRLLERDFTHGCTHGARSWKGPLEGKYEPYSHFTQ